MSLTAEQILTSFEDVAREVTLSYLELAAPQDPVEKAWLGVCRRLVSMLDSMPEEIPWDNHVQILDMEMWLPIEIKAQMSQQGHPFYQAWLIAVETLGVEM